jgi:hypothetical protein
MKRRLWIAVGLVVLAMVPTLAQARGYGRYGGMVNTPYGPMNMKSPEYRMSGGNPIVYQQLMQEKMMMQQQLQMLKQQQQAMQQMQKATKNKNGSQSFTPVSNVTSLAPSRARKKKKRSATVTKSVAAPASSKKSVDTAKPEPAQP